MNRSKLLAAGKLLLGMTLIVIVVGQVDMTALWERLASVDLSYLAAVFVLPHIAILLCTIKWQMLLKVLDINVCLRRLFALYLIGTFFNNFLPTMIGGDVVRTYTLNRETGEGSSVIAATFMERFIGLAALVSLLPLILWQQVAVNKFPLLKQTVFLVIIFYLVSVFLVLKPATVHVQRRMAVNSVFDRIWSIVKKIHVRVYRFRCFKRTMLVSYGYSLAFYVVTVGSTWAATRSVGADVDFWFLLAIVPVVLLAGLLPVSLNGLGVTEAGYVIFLQLVDVSAVDAVATALLLRGRLLVTAVIGGVIFLWYRVEKRGETVPDGLRNDDQDMGA
ncbi:flippase-like domain-containing protein [Gammaproteobacteria bacterium]|nr:flippase-like domain-containing protein [Gammaproteobacteria bacterium]